MQHLRSMLRRRLSGCEPAFKCDSVIKRNQPNCPKNTQGAGGRFLGIAKSGQIGYFTVSRAARRELPFKDRCGLGWGFKLRGVEWVGGWCKCYLACFPIRAKSASQPWAGEATSSTSRAAAIPHTFLKSLHIILTPLLIELLPHSLGLWIDSGTRLLVGWRRAALY